MNACCSLTVFAAIAVSQVAAQPPIHGDGLVSVIEHAQLSAAPYGIGFQPFDRGREPFTPVCQHHEPLSGLDWAIYRRDNEVVLSFGGTASTRDWLANLSQGAQVLSGPNTMQYEDALLITKELQRTLADSHFKLTVVGHSLGGALASYVSAMTGVPARVFNAAALSRGTIQSVGRTRLREADITHFNLRGDPVSIGTPLIPGAGHGGAAYEISSGGALGLIDSHSIETMINQLEETRRYSGQIRPISAPSTTEVVRYDDQLLDLTGAGDMRSLIDLHPGFEMRLGQGPDLMPDHNHIDTSALWGPVSMLSTRSAIQRSIDLAPTLQFGDGGRYLDARLHGTRGHWEVSGPNAWAAGAYAMGGTLDNGRWHRYGAVARFRNQIDMSGSLRSGWETVHEHSHGWDPLRTTTTRSRHSSTSIRFSGSDISHRVAAYEHTGIWDPPGTDLSGGVPQSSSDRGGGVAGPGGVLLELDVGSHDVTATSQSKEKADLIDTLRNKGN